MKQDNTQELLERLSSLPELDFASAMERVDNQGDILISSLRVLMDKLPSLQEKMETALESGDMKSFGTTAHGLKSSCYGIGATALGDEALELEKAGKAADEAFCREHFGPWEAKIRQYYDRLTSLFKELDVPKTYVGTGNTESLLTLLGDVGKMLEAYQCDEAIELLEDVGQYDYGEELNAKIDRILRICQSFGYDEAKTMIAEITGGKP